MVRVANLEEEIEGFLDQQAREHLARLEAKRADLWAECRKIEDVIGAHIAEVGRVNSAANDRARVVADQRAKVHQATPPPFATNFPNQAETEAWNGRLAAARSGLAQAIEEQNEINLASVGCESTPRGSRARTRCQGRGTTRGRFGADRLSEKEVTISVPGGTVLPGRTFAEPAAMAFLSFRNAAKPDAATARVVTSPVTARHGPAFPVEGRPAFVEH